MKTFSPDSSLTLGLWSRAHAAIAGCKFSGKGENYGPGRNSGNLISIVSPLIRPQISTMDLKVASLFGVQGKKALVTGGGTGWVLRPPQARRRPAGADTLLSLGSEK